MRELITMILSATLGGMGGGRVGPGVPGFTVRDGYEVTRAVTGIDDARFLEFDDRGTLYVSVPERGFVYALRDEDGDGEYETRDRFLKGYPSVQMMQFRDGWMWLATTSSIERARDTDGDLRADEEVTIIPKRDLPGGSVHWWRALLVDDEHFYTSIGDSGNIEDERQTDRQKIWRYNLDGTGKTLFATGVRNTEELRFRPGTDEIWGIDHGSDWFGRRYGDSRWSQPITDRLPPDELNHYVQGAFYGHPFIVGNLIPRPEHADREDLHEHARNTTPPEWEIGAHWAANGFTFIEPDRNRGRHALPRSHDGDLYFAARGSWNSSEPVGYCVARILFDDGKPYGLLKVVSTLSASGEVLGRPVDVVQAPDGSLLFSVDDPVGVVYRIRWIGEED